MTLSLRLVRLTVACAGLLAFIAVAMPPAQAQQQTSAPRAPVASPTSNGTSEAKPAQVFPPPPPPPKPSNPADFWLAHRYLDDVGSGWGWVKRPGEDWKKATWVTLKENPAKGRSAPFRRMESRSADHDYEYKVWGTIASYKAYDPHTDELIPVFVLESYELIGPGPDLKMKPGPGNRARLSGNRGSTGSTSRPRF